VGDLIYKVGAVSGAQCTLAARESQEILVVLAACALGYCYVLWGFIKTFLSRADVASSILSRGK
jgi:hypothetical protein